VLRNSRISPRTSPRTSRSFIMPFTLRAPRRD
jgi:hypothetical protein